MRLVREPLSLGDRSLRTTRVALELRELNMRGPAEQPARELRWLDRLERKPRGIVNRDGPCVSG